ncbi:heparan-alpha-glucosaminide N-acetyltransferase domain-containing protein [Georgenia wangjunii]|uniref:heparan-alpha-glucosaminide N-acetyltransferase domain-containing protein n=1 Tax=Georgenia wangjunii TaxID=3117730 RepID=UPI002F26D41C
MLDFADRRSGSRAMIPSMGDVGKRRVLYVDWARGLAISLALFSHAMLGVAGWESLSADYPALYGLRVITRAATLTFIFLFGISLEFAYVRRWEHDPGTVRRRLLKRAAQCYGALLLLAIAAFIGGSMSGPEVLLAAVLAAPVLNGVIFVFYAVTMLLAMALVPLRRRIGVLPTLALTLAWWPTAALLRSLNPTDPRLDSITSRVLGIGDELGPSVLHALPIVVLGMAVGRWIRTPQDRGARRDAGIGVGMAVVGGLAAGFIDGPFAAVTHFVHDYRATNHFGYYAIGASAALAILGLCWLIETRTRLLSRRGPWTFGGHSLQAFMLGNVGINLFTGHVFLPNGLVGILFSAGYVGLFWVALRAWRTYRSTTASSRATASAAR